jgi:hypothetical protein
MHQPGYVQGGQEVGRNYLLLRIHVRRIRGIDIDRKAKELESYSACEPESKRAKSQRPKTAKSPF